ncbi:MAG: hypothetical protein M3441_15425, partial [Chloroflexota bacterium]|nr:hypothetical protein [Chloroflexota bacterium]
MDWLKINSTGRFLLYGLLALTLLAIVAGLLTRGPSSESALEAGAALAMIASIALGIERAQEVFWAAIDSKYGSWWPFALVTKPVNDLQDQLKKELPNYLIDARAALLDLRSKGQLAQDELDRLNANLDNAQAELTALGTSLSDVRKLKGVLTALQTNLKSVQEKIPQGRSALTFGNEVVDLVTGV